MVDFLNRIWNRLSEQAKETPVKFLLEMASLIGVASVLIGVITQINALSYSDLAFFSSTQAINDGILTLPVLLAVLLGWYAGCATIRPIGKVLDHVKGDWYYVFASVLFFLISWRALYLVLEFGKNIQGNMISYLLTWVIYFLWTVSVIVPLYVFSASVSATFTTRKFNRIPVWLEEARWYLVPLLVATFAGFTVFVIDFMPKSVNKYHCVEWEQQILGIEYLNDKYVFTTNKLVLENKGRTFYRNTDCQKSNAVFYIKKNNECMKVDNFDKDFISVAKIGLVSNSGYDFYTDRGCKSK